MSVTEGGVTPEFVYAQLRLVALSVLTLAFVVFLQGNGLARLQKRHDARLSDINLLFGRVDKVEQEQIAGRLRHDAKPAARPAAKKATAGKAAG